MEYNLQSDSVEVLINYPEKRDINYFKNQTNLNDFLLNVKRFAFPYLKTLNVKNDRKSSQSLALVQFYTFVFTDENRIRQYGFCRSAKGGAHILCIVSYLPWYNVFMNILNKISNVINEKEVILFIISTYLGEY